MLLIIITNNFKCVANVTFGIWRKNQICGIIDGVGSGYCFAHQGKLMKILSRAWLIERYVVRGLSIEQIAREVGVAAPKIRRRVRDYRLLPKQRYSDNAEPGAPTLKPGDYYWNPPSKAWLTDQHLTQQKAISDIAADIGASEGTIRRWLTAEGLPIRAYPTRKQKRCNPTRR